MNHKKEKHPSLVAICEKYKGNNCKYSTEMCWWRHAALENDSKLKCFTRSKTFQTKGVMMIHRKQEHVRNVKTRLSCFNVKTKLL